MLNYERVKSDTQSAESYSKRRPEKHAFEMQMVSEAMQLLPLGEVRTVLDAPCGVGRLTVWLGQKGYEVTGVDLGEAAIDFTRAALAERGIKATACVQNVFKMEFGDVSFDASVCFRLLHHFQNRADQAALIKELCRVSRRYVVISHFSPFSVTTWRRKVRRLLTGKPLKQNPNSLGQLKEYFNASDFTYYGKVRRSGLLHSLQLAIFVRNR